jgi:hypothetical protein
MDFQPVIGVQGRALPLSELSALQQLIDEHPQWSRHRLAQELCQQWNWRTPLGQLKTFAARSLLLKLAQRHQLRLPRLQVEKRRRPWGLVTGPGLPCPPPEPVKEPLAQLAPVGWQLCPYGTEGRQRALGYLRGYHYLGCSRPVGAHLLYLVQDGQGRDLAVHLVGAAAWQCAARDAYIGWKAPARRQHLPRIANHSRFLILPGVRVPGLASHLLGGLTRRVARDWRAQHGGDLLLLETFVENGRFLGTAYRAANWQRVGQTTGRTRQEKRHQAIAPSKSVWVYPLTPRFRNGLGALSSFQGGAHE